LSSGTGCGLRALDRHDGRIEQLRRLGGRPAQHVVQQQDGSLTRREMLDRGDEGELHRFT
jgi:hypothetical protein